MVNSGQDSKKNDNGVVYTPLNLAEYVSKKLIDYWAQDLKLEELSSNSVQEILSTIKIIDPACGDGELLQAVKSEVDKRFCRDITQGLFGFDLDEAAANAAKEKICKDNQKDSVFKNFHSLNTITTKGVRLTKGFGKFDLLIANPPWGANTLSYKDELNQMGYRLATGQYDTSDIFIEKSLSMVKKGGYCAFIVPDSLFFQERKELRRLLAENTDIKFVARLGEKIFKDINRACSIIIFKNAKPNSKNSMVKCMRLTPHFRANILSNRMTFEDAETKLAHAISQDRFLNHPLYMFDIDTKDSELELLSSIVSNNSRVGDYLTSSRGVELSKSGNVYKCNHCSQWSPLPKKELSICKYCKVASTTDNRQKIITTKRSKKLTPIIVGENIRRYAITSKSFIDTDFKGINYKNEALYKGPKILVRKTGVGITASIDYTDAMTNQVVYIFKPKESTKNAVSLEFILAVLNSRIMHYYLVKSFGESEWRSYPYLTQSQILGLPIPDLSTDRATKIAHDIESLVFKQLSNNDEITDEIDAKIERKMAELFKLRAYDYSAIFKNLSENQSLVPVKALSNLKLQSIFS